MGMDVYGTEPTAPEGEYFQRNVWGWRPLATLCQRLAPAIAARCTHWDTNDADGLDATDAAALAEVLEHALASGAIKAYVERREVELAALPDETCTICDGTGIRCDEIGKADGQPGRVIDTPAHPRHGQTGWCNGCDGRGAKKAFARHYFLGERDVREFAAFLKACGGFEIC